MTIRKDGRLTVAAIGEFYEDLLRVDSWINARTMASQASLLLCEKLMQNQIEIRNQVACLANKRGISANELWNQILSGEAEKEILLSEDNDKNDISTNENP